MKVKGNVKCNCKRQEKRKDFEQVRKFSSSEKGHKVSAYVDEQSPGSLLPTSLHSPAHGVWQDLFQSDASPILGVGSDDAEKRQLCSMPLTADIRDIATRQQSLL